MTTKGLKKKLWKLFRLLIYKRDKGICQSCGANLRDKTWNAGHLISQGTAGSYCGETLWVHLLNVWVQCVVCNNSAGGNQIELNRRVSEKLGFNVYEYLFAIRRAEQERKRKTMEKWEPKKIQRLIEALEKGENYQEIHKQVYKL